MSTPGRQVRGRGDGTISQRKDGRFEIRIKDPVTGQRRSAYAKSLVEARRKLREMVKRKEEGETVIDAGVSVGQFAHAWIRDTAGMRRRESTVREYARRLDRFVLPILGDKRLGEVSPLDVERVLDSAGATGLSRSSLQGIKNALSAMLSDAVRGRQLRVNVAASARLPERPVKPTRAHATVQEVGSLLRVAEGSEMGDLLVLLTYTGCRIGEALGAKWSDLDLERGHWMLSRTTTVNLAGQVVVGDRTKTGEARVVNLQPPALNALRAQRARVAGAKLKAGRLWQDNDLVFPTSIGTPTDARNLRKELAVYAKESGYRHSFHELRHVFATIAASEVNMSALSKVLGHRRLATTSDLYAHLYEPDATRAAAAVARVLGSGGEFGTEAERN